MKIIFNLLLLVVIVYQPMLAQESLKNPETAFLLGNYEVQVFLPNKQGGWNVGGSGKAQVTPILDGTYVQETISTKIGNTTMNMQTTIGKDGRTGKWRLIALDKEYSVMDVYNGKLEGETFIFDNLKSDVPATTQNGEKLSFRLTFTRDVESQHKLLVEYTKDDGETWFPYAKQIYVKSDDTVK